MKRASYGQASTQKPQPMQTARSTETMPSSRCAVAPEGQASTQGGRSHWLHWATNGLWTRRGKVPSRTVVRTWVRACPGGTSHSALQATVQAWQPTHLLRSVTIA